MFNGNFKMINRDIEIQKIRPIIDFEEVEPSPFNNFQQALRQILKFQNNLLVESCFYYLQTKYKGFIAKDEVFKKDALYESLKKDIAFKKDLIGMIKGLMTLPEITFYNQNAADINKRLMEFIFKRVYPQIMEKK